MFAQQVRARWVPQARWLREKVSALPYSAQVEVLERHKKLIGATSGQSTSPLFVANQFAVTTVAELVRSKLRLAFDEEAVRYHAENYARLCERLDTLEAREAFARATGVPVPEGRTYTREGKALRLASPRWWRRVLRKSWTRSSENSLRVLGVVRRGKAPYASDDAVAHRAAQKRRMFQFKQDHVAINELGEQLSLFDVAEKSIANPALRRGEFMTRVRGFEEVASQFGHVALFFTLTCPSHYHAQLASGGDNPAFSRGTVRDAQEWMCKVWARARAKLHRKKVVLYGFRIAEPHHDGTPHWHGLVFTRANTEDVVSDVISRSFLQEHGDDRGARDYRVRFEKIDSAKGSAAGYIAKYVSKNIDGTGAIGAAESDETGTPVSDTVSRVEAWAAIHGIRQFQQLGGPPVGLWRELRRLHDAVPDADIERARDAADRGQWRRFMLAVFGGDVACHRHAANIKLWKEETGERSSFGEPRPARLLGVRCSSARQVTREHTWTIERKGRSHSRPVAGASLETTSAQESRPSDSGSSSESVPVSTPASPVSLGPVAITVRGRKAVLILGVGWRYADALEAVA
jgi:hypothetical protein